MHLLLNRFLMSGVQTLGVLTAINDLHQGVYKCNTLELPWKQNARQVSCIPAGMYDVVKRQSPKYGQHFQLLNVPGRDMILIHSGNFTRDTHGCILVGQGFTDIDNDGLRDLQFSKKTLAELYKILPDRFQIVITNPKI